MIPERLQTIETIFHSARELQPSSRSSFLDQACSTDAELRAEIESLLNAHESADGFIAKPAPEIAAEVLANEQAALSVGRMFGHYRLLEPLGRGGMGEVYLAADTKSGRKAALKLLPLRFTGDAERFNRFQQEARTVIALNHPNIVTIYEIGEDDSTHYIVSELIEGETLQQRLARGRMELSEALDITLQVASALAAAHRAGIVHRDIKPENIMLRPDGYVKVLDFGIAKLAEESEPTALAKEEALLLLIETSAGRLLGTARYMSPEQARGLSVDERTDIWSLGAVLYEMVSGCTPFKGETPTDVINSILTAAPSTLTGFRPEVSADLQQIVAKALRKDRQERYGSVNEMAEALKDLRRNLEADGQTKPAWRRWKVTSLLLTLLVAALIAVVVIGLAGALWELRRVQAERELVKRANLSEQEKARLTVEQTNNPAAYDAYLRARAFPGWWHQEGAIRLFQEAVKLDPNFVLAWAYLSIGQSTGYWIGTDPSRARLVAAKDALDRALALDPDLPEVHLALGYYRYYGPRDYAGALAEFRQAEKGLPNSADVIEALAALQRRLGHWDEAIAEQRRAVELDPRNIHACWDLATTYRILRRFPEALATVERALEWVPANRDLGMVSMKAEILLATGDLQAMEPLLANPRLDPTLHAVYALFQRRYAEAIEILSKALATETDRNARNTEKLLLGLSQQRAGDIAAARATYRDAAQDFDSQLKKMPPDSFVAGQTHAFLGQAYAGLGEAASAIAEGQKAMAIHPTSKDPADGPVEEESMARVYALLGETDHAIPILKRLLQIPYSGAITPALLRLDPIWDQIRNDPRFQELVSEKQP
jgi:serine/threonine protein kinase/Flp pilus assembly protein TadD